VIVNSSYGRRNIQGQSNMSKGNSVEESEENVRGGAYVGVMSRKILGVRRDSPQVDNVRGEKESELILGRSRESLQENYNNSCVQSCDVKPGNKVVRERCSAVLRGGVGKVFVDRGFQVSEDMLGNLKGDRQGSKQVCEIEEKQFETDLKKVFNNILEVVAEVELENDALEEHSSKISIGRAQQYGSRLNRNSGHVKSEGQVTKMVGGEIVRDKLSTSSIQKEDVVDKSCKKSKNKLEESDFAGWDSIEVLGDNSVGVKACVMNVESDSGNEGMTFRHRVRRGWRICERGKGEVIEV
jgi:hypothetical protein